MTEMMPPKEQVSRAAFQAAVMGTVNVLVLILSARLIVLISVCGGIYLTLVALGQPDPWRLGVLITFCLGVVGPAVYLAAHR
jgi:hypothetical protein